MKDKAALPITLSARASFAVAANEDQTADSALNDYRSFLGLVKELWPVPQTAPRGLNKFAVDLWRLDLPKDSPEGRDRAHLLLNPHACDLLALTEQEFRTVAARIGPDVYRLRFVPRILADPKKASISSGGSCAIETWGVWLCSALQERVRREARPAKDGVLAWVMEELLNLAPTITHVSGAILSGSDCQIHFLETALWTQTLAKAGVDRAAEKVARAYQRIHAAVERRAKLINPNACLYALNFDDLGLRNSVGKLPPVVPAWIKGLGVPYDPDFGIADVFYTYVGPQLLPRVKAALSHAHGGDLHPDLLKADLICRLKQIDHNSWDSTDLPSALILGERPPTLDEIERSRSKQAFRFGIQMGRWIYEQQPASTSQVAGFFDLPFGQQIFHMTYDLPRGQGASSRCAGSTELESWIEAILNSPVRLHQRNLDQHLDYLSGWIETDSGDQRQTLQQERNKLVEDAREIFRLRAQAQKQIDQLEQELQQRRIRELRMCKHSALLESLLRLEPPPLLDGEPDLDSFLKLRYRGLVNSIADRRREQGESEIQLNELERLDVQDALQVSRVVRRVKAGRPWNLNTASERRFQQWLADIQLALSTVRADIALKETLLEAQQQTHKHLEERCTPLETEIEFINSRIENLPRYFPVQSNPYVIHACNFLWDPDFREFLKDVTALHIKYQRSKKERDSSVAAVELLEANFQRCCRRIAPKLFSYCRYIFSESEQYPSIRSTRIYESSALPPDRK